jgi:hypothetical protein
VLTRWIGQLLFSTLSTQNRRSEPSPMLAGRWTAAAYAL